MIIPRPSAVLDVTTEDGAVIRLRRHGNLGGPRVFVSHGNGFATDGYAAFWRHFLAGFEVVAFDMRNHGHNPTGDLATHDYRHMARDIAAVRQAAVAEFGAKPSAGLFHSMAAQSAMLAALAGEHFAALVLFDPPNVPPAGDAARDPMLAYLRRLTEWAAGRRERFDDPAQLAEDYVATRSGRDWPPGTHDLMSRAVLRPQPDGNWSLACPRAFESSMYAQGIPLVLWPHSAALATPVKLIGGDPDRAFASPTALSNRALAQYGGFDYAAIPGGSHLLQLEQPDACAAVALDFLDEIGFR